ncbi:MULTISPECIES: alpha/beta hydrolase [Mycolicibacterium]|uniref:Esterase/lipase n=2 Tax=Mycolicibacterium gilvum TaxID=1804 RepID=E6TKS8_MYCSR|nr:MULTISPECIES: alpha/beta hydrolase [Mycolicibacterium]ABP42934.1 Alpha/beta hydrolase fold-3 domain protein [Mycolicibacterium gilvum PYR-GCK]ADT97028.1 esterase/lipase [Mycolicibacterium gilvum Spyr1]MBV5244793.1 alpha/beta hydrolase [Mycolicibacterium sp. PAM1]
MTERPDTRYPGPTLTTRLEWLLNAGPSDYMLALSVASASLPVIGKHLEPLGALTAAGVWGARHAPDFVGALAKSLVAPNDVGKKEKQQQERDSTNAITQAALRGLVSQKDLEIEWPAAERTPPVWKMREHRRHVHRTSVRYGPRPTQLLDVWRRDDVPADAPVMIFVPGGAWVHGGRMLQGYALMHHLAEMGWVCLSVEYRVAPHNPWPAHINDVKTAIAWARANVDKFGGNRDFVAIAGTSAGGHLAALAGLTANDPEMQGELPEGSDTSVDAVVGIYGRYDWEDKSTVERVRFMDFLERVVVKRKFDKHPDVFRKASPMARIHSEAPPFLVIHGTGDSVIPVAQAQSFVERLRNVSRSVVGYVELPGAGHGFDMTDGARTGAAATAIGLFLNHIHRNRSLVGAKEVI